MFNKFAVGCLLSTFILALAGCGSAGSGTTATDEEIQKAIQVAAEDLKESMKASGKTIITTKRK